MVIVFGQGDEQPEWSWLDKTTWDFQQRVKEESSKAFNINNGVREARKD